MTFKLDYIKLLVAMGHSGAFYKVHDETITNYFIFSIFFKDKKLFNNSNYVCFEPDDYGWYQLDTTDNYKKCYLIRDTDFKFYNYVWAYGHDIHYGPCAQLELINLSRVLELVCPKAQEQILFNLEFFNSGDN